MLIPAIPIAYLGVGCSCSVSWALPERPHLVERRRTYEQHQEQYDAIQTENPQGDNVGVGASVLLISGCMDNQLSRDGDRNGLFTQTLKDVWNDGTFSGSYQSFRNEIVDRMPSDQTPDFFRVGQVAPLFEQQTPFTI